MGEYLKSVVNNIEASKSVILELVMFGQSCCKLVKVTSCPANHYFLPNTAWRQNPLRTNVPNSTATPQEEQLCHIILKSMQKCRSYGRNVEVMAQPGQAQFMTILSFDLRA